MISRITSLAWTGFLQLVRSRVYLNILVAGIGIVVASLAMDKLSAGESGRVLFNVGCAFISLVVATLAGTLAITAVTRDLETKQAHLVLARPIGRAEFVIARFLTTSLLVVLANLTLGALMAILLLALDVPKDAGLAFASCLFASFEGFIVAAIAIFFGVGSSSTMAAVFTTTIFVLGRLTGELHDVVGRRAFGGATPLLDGVYRVLPHFPVFDLTPMADAPRAPSEIMLAAAYGVAYTMFFLFAASFRFSRRDLL